jgi:hypothetical protein
VVLELLDPLELELEKAGQINTVLVTGLEIGPLNMELELVVLVLVLEPEPEPEQVVLELVQVLTKNGLINLELEIGLPNTEEQEIPGLINIPQQLRLKMLS